MKPTRLISSCCWYLILVLTLPTLKSHAQVGKIFGLPCPCNTDSLVRYRLTNQRLSGLVDMADLLLKLKDERIDSLTAQAQRRADGQATRLLASKVENERLTGENAQLTADKRQLQKDARRYRIGAALGGLAALLGLLSAL